MGYSDVTWFRPSRRFAGVVLVLLAGVIQPEEARANGAFPDSLQLLLPPAVPAEIVLATNFGLVGTEDGGLTWEWSCEHGQSLGGWLYQLGWRLGGTRILAISDSGLVFTDDTGCSWRRASGMPAGTLVKDFFVDRTDPRKVFCVARTPDGGGGGDQLLVSEDGGESFGTPLMQAPEGVSLVGIESAASDPSTLYLTMGGDNPVSPGVVAQSKDGGSTWQTFGLSDDLARARLGIVGISSGSPDEVLFRSRVGIRDRLALSVDGGRSVEIVLDVNGVLTSYVERADGTILVGAIEEAGGALFVSRDRGRSFQRSPGPAPRFRALGERDGRVYAVGDDILDGFSLASSDDEGRTWQSVMRFKQVVGVRPCVGLAATCSGSCMRMAGLGVFAREVCGVAPPPPAGPPSPPVEEVVAPIDNPSSGCDCSASTGAPASVVVVGWFAGLVLVIWRRFGARRRAKAPSPGPAGL